MNKGLKKRFPFTRRYVNMQRNSIDCAHTEIDELLRKQCWNNALAKSLRIADTTGCDFNFSSLLRNITLDETSLRMNNTKKSWYLLGESFYSGAGGIRKDRKEAYICFCKAAKMSHPGSMGSKAYMLCHGDGVERDEEAGMRCFIRAAELGCVSYYITTGDAFMLGNGVPQNYMMAAYWYQMIEESQSDFLKILKEHPFECTPWGLWTPLDMDMQIRIMEPVRKAQFAWMLISKRLQIPKGVALIITSFICARSGWK